VGVRDGDWESDRAFVDVEAGKAVREAFGIATLADAWVVVGVGWLADTTG
jgi:hypothetical protein